VVQQGVREGKKENWKKGKEQSRFDLFFSLFPLFPFSSLHNDLPRMAKVDTDIDTRFRVEP
jgi:hypothetical protein